MKDGVEGDKDEGMRANVVLELIETRLEPYISCSIAPASVGLRGRTGDGKVG